MEIRDSLEKIKKANCENCKSSTAVKFCQQCKIMMCDKCTEMHRMWGGFRDHKLVDIDEMRASASDMLAPVNQTPKCPRHPEMDAKIYCETCSELICSDCTIHHHKDHLYDLAREVLDKHKEEIIIRLVPLREQLKKAQEGLEALDNAVEKFNEQEADIKDKIRSQIEQLKHLLDQRREELLGSLDLQCQKQKKDLAKQRDSVKITHSKISSCLKYAESGLETGTVGEVLSMKTPVLKRIEEITTECNLEEMQIKTDNFEFTIDERVKRACQQVGKLSCDSIIASEPIYETIEKRSTQTNSELHLAQQVTEVEKEIAKKPVEVRPHSVAMAPSPETATNSIPLKIIQLQGPNGPYVAAIDSRGQLVVSELSANRITVLASNDKKLFSFGKKGSEQGQFKSPCGIAIDHKDNIYVADSNNDRIQKFTSKGKFVAAVGSHGHQPLEFNNPVGLCFNKTNHQLYVCDQGNNRIQVLTTDLKLVRSIHTQPTQGV